MTTPLAPQNGLWTRAYLGEVDLLTEELFEIGWSHSTGVTEGQTFNTAGILRAPTSKDGSVRMKTLVADKQELFDAPGTNHGLIVTSSVGTNATFVANVPVAGIASDVQIGEFRKYEIDNSPTNGLPGWGGMNYDKIGSAISAAENSAGSQLGAKVAGQQLILQVVVTAFTGTNITIDIEHDMTGFPSPTTVSWPSSLTFTGTGSEGRTKTLATGPTDSYWRFAITGTFSSAELLAGFAAT